MSKQSYLAISLALALAPAGFAQQPGSLQFENYPELFYSPGGAAPVNKNGEQPKVVARLAAYDGHVEFVRHLDGGIGMGIVGVQTGRVVDYLLDNHFATSLEIFLTLGGTRPPKELVYAHTLASARDGLGARAARNLNDAIGPNVLTGKEPSGGSAGGTACTPALGPFCAENVIDGGACGDGDFSLWSYWFNTNTNYDNWGSNNIDETGEASGNANVTLGPTSTGIVTVCNIGDGSRLDVDEYVAGIGWVRIWTQGYVYPHFAYIYRFTGWHIRNIRMAVRDNTGDFFWGGSY